MKTVGSQHRPAFWAGTVRRISTGAVVVGAVGSIALLGCGMANAAPVGDPPTAIVVTADQGTQQIVVPDGVNAVYAVVEGGSGGASRQQGRVALGGRGAEVTGTFRVVPGEVLTVVAGQEGQDATGGTAAAAGGTGGAAPGGAGVSYNPNAAKPQDYQANAAGGGGAGMILSGSNPLMIAGGGGGAGGNGDGSFVGGFGGNAGAGWNGADGAIGGGMKYGGHGHAGASNSMSGLAGATGTDGDGGNGGGGGGGYHGGGGGFHGGQQGLGVGSTGTSGEGDSGGGGGSGTSFHEVGISNSSITAAPQGDGEVILYWS